MDAYIDLSYILHLLVLFTLPYYFKRIIGINLKKIEIISLGVFSIILYFNVFVFTNYKYLNFVFLFIYFLFFYHRNFFKYYLLYLFVYYGNIAVMMIFTREIYLLNGMIFISNPKNIFLILFSLMNITIIEIIVFSIRSIKLLKNYHLKIRIKINDKFNDFSGYIDSGNTLLIDNLPVIFLKENYFKNNDYKEMIVNGIGKRKCKYFKTLVSINGEVKEVICASGNSKGFKGCDCLINICLLEEKR